MVRARGLEPPRGCPRSHLKAVRLPISPRPRTVNNLIEPHLRRGRYFFGCAGAGWPAGSCMVPLAGAGPLGGVAGFAGAVCDPDESRTVLAFEDARPAKIDSDSDVIMKTIAEPVVAFESSVAEPRGPKAVCDPMPPNAPAKSAAFPLCSSTTMIRKTQTIT